MPYDTRVPFPALWLSSHFCHQWPYMSQPVPVPLLSLFFSHHHLTEVKLDYAEICQSRVMMLSTLWSFIRIFCCCCCWKNSWTPLFFPPSLFEKSWCDSGGVAPEASDALLKMMGVKGGPKGGIRGAWKELSRVVIWWTDAFPLWVSSSLVFVQPFSRSRLHAFFFLTALHHQCAAALEERGKPVWSFSSGRHSHRHSLPHMELQ